MTGAPGDNGYFSHLRTDVLAVIPSDASTILSVGCGSGRTEGELVKAGKQVYGIEQNEHAAAQAREAGIRVIVGDACSDGTLPEGVTFDCLIYADVLEHIADPVAVLRRHVSLLRPGGTVVVSVPNFRHYAVFMQLFVQGHIRYTDAGIFDRTHLRITTRKMVEGWFREVGVSPAERRHTFSRRRDQALSMLSLGTAKEFLARQVLITGRKD
jgi:SAM-dependent methyltransferase